MILLSVALGAVALMLLLPSISDGVAAICIALEQTPKRDAEPAAGTPRLVMLIPAHDEETLLGPCLASLARMNYPPDGVTTIVVADNCTDATASIARAAGVRVLERADATRRGKPWAIAWALERIGDEPWDAIVILDADSLVDPDFASALAALPALRTIVAQGYIDVSNRADTALTRMAWVWSAIRFRTVNGLKNRCGLNVPLGDGVCIGRDALRNAGGWTAFALSETWELYASMTALGIRCVGVPTAHLYAQEARALRQSASQRRRWTAGRLQVLRRYGARLLTGAGIPWHQRLDILAELTALGPAAQLGVSAIAIVIAGATRAPGWPILVTALAIPIARIGLYALNAVARGPEPVRTLAAFAYLPIYTAWRLIVQIGALRLVGNGAWVRTARHRADTDAALPDKGERRR